MKKPRKPPSFSFPDDFERTRSLFRHSSLTVRGKYLHWDKLLRYSPPGDLTHQEWWTAIKLARKASYKEVPLVDKGGASFVYTQVDPIQERLHEIDKKTAGSIEVSDPITNPETKDRYYVSSLIEEAITSSQLEGATTTRQIAREMIRAGRAPRDRSEQMILNNFLAMRRIGELRTQPLSVETIFSIHQIVTEKTLHDSSAAGRLRTSHDEPVVVADENNEIFHHPPPPEELEKRMEAMCRFANADDDGEFFHPVLRSIIIHFWLAYDHPFVDGNGRTARALFYWSMLHYGYWLFEFVSISNEILRGPTKYSRAFLYTETDDNDLTYFILYHLDIIQRAINDLHTYIKRKTQELQQLEGVIRSSMSLNHRQRALISHALRHPNHLYTIESHRKSHDVVYQTGRSDLLDLSDKGLLEAIKIGRTRHFKPVPDLESRLSSKT